ncbi:MAG TPA: class I SAM-dependent methyltransferase [Gemmataceae bacterium]|nr:class I SAM-dependent methyltransferase [Gemmataceae bacterium]
MPNPTARFSDRVADYVRTRPGYPPAVLDILRAETGLTPATVVADIGSGTGLSAEMFLKNGNPVFGVEPNPDMRAAGDAYLAGYPHFQSVAGTAEATTLPDTSVDLIVAGQAFHWFDVPRARAEFQRILRSGGSVALMWNTRRVDSTLFLRAYEALLQRFGTDYREVVHTNVERATLAAFFGPGGFKEFKLDNPQLFDRDGLRGRLRSSSYTPPPGHPNFEPMLAELDRIFDLYKDGGRVRFECDTEVYVGRLT